MQHLLFITRKTSGIGGMQRLNTDLWRGFQQFSNVQSRRIVPYAPGDFSFPLRACFSALFLRSKDARIHLGDAALCPLGLMLRFLSGSNVSVTVCGLDVTFHHWWYQFLIRWSLPKMDHVVSISRSTLEEVKKRGVDVRKISLIPCGIWQEDHRRAIRQSNQHLRLITIGRLIPRKGVAWFLSEVFPLLLRRHPELQYDIYGSGPDSSRIRTIIREKKLDESVTLREDLQDCDLGSALSKATIFVMPNIQIKDDPEGFGIVCIEASAAGLPVCAARVEGIQDAVIAGKTGEFFQAQNVESCLQCIEEMLHHPLVPSSVREETLRRFTWSTLLVSYYHDVFQFS